MSEVREDFEKADPLTWMQIHNLLPIIVILVGMGITWGIFTSRLDFNDKRYDMLENKYDLMKTEQDSQGRLLIRISERLGVSNILGVSTNSANLGR